QVHRDLAGGDDRLGVTLGAANHGVDAGDQLVLVERLGHVVVRAAAERLDLGVDLARARQDHHRGVDLADPQLTQNFQTIHVRQVQVQKNKVVVVDLAQIDAFLTQIGGVDVEALGLEHQLDALRSRAVVLDEQNTHWRPSRQSLAVGLPAKPPDNLSGTLSVQKLKSG